MLYTNQITKIRDATLSLLDHQRTKFSLSDFVLIKQKTRKQSHQSETLLASFSTFLKDIIIDIKNKSLCQAFSAFFANKVAKKGNLIK
jgi:hypothetical protein